MQWISEAEQIYEMDDANSQIYHDPPAYWIIDSIICEHLFRLPNDRYRDAEKQIGLALDLPARDFTENVNWPSYLTRVNNALAKFGGKLPSAININQIIRSTSPGTPTVVNKSTNAINVNWAIFDSPSRLRTQRQAGPSPTASKFVLQTATVTEPLLAKAK